MSARCSLCRCKPCRCLQSLHRSALWVCFWAAVILGVLVAASCRPREIPPLDSDNFWCHGDGFTERSVRGRLRSSIDIGGGQCRCDCTGVPADLICTITATVGS